MAALQDPRCTKYSARRKRSPRFAHSTAVGQRQIPQWFAYSFYLSQRVCISNLNHGNGTELNTWLERFVEQHTSQTLFLTQGVTELVEGLGLNRPTNMPNLPPGHDQHLSPPNLTSLITDIHQVVLDLRQRESGHAALQNNLNHLVHKINNDIERMGAERQALSSSLNFLTRNVASPDLSRVRSGCRRQGHV